LAKHLEDLRGQTALEEAIRQAIRPDPEGKPWASLNAISSQAGPFFPIPQSYNLHNRQLLLGTAAN